MGIVTVAGVEIGMEGTVPPSSSFSSKGSYDVWRPLYMLLTGGGGCANGLMPVGAGGLDPPPKPCA